MPLFWEKITPVLKAVWIATLFVFLFVEYRAIDKDHKEAGDQQKEELKTIGEGFQHILTDQQTSFSSLILQSQNNFSRILEKSTKAQRQENKNFLAMLNRQQKLFTSEQDLFDFSSGKLLPANDPTPTNCDPLSPSEFLIKMGDMAYVTNTMPFNLLAVSGKVVISIDKSETGALLVSVNLNAPDGRIIARITKNSSTVNPASGLIVTRDASTLLLQDQYGKDMINARYLNKHAFSITGLIPHTGGNITLPLAMFSSGCMRISGSGGTAISIN